MTSAQKILFCFTASCFIGAGVVSYFNRPPDVSRMPEAIQNVIPLDKPTNIELFEDDAGVSAE